jgi:hypothetical protein
MSALSDQYLFNGTRSVINGTTVFNGNSRGCQGTVILPLKPCSFDGIGNFKILDLPYETKLIW